MYGSVGSIIVELVVVGLLALGVISGVKKGFFKSLMDLLILAVAVFAAVQVCRWATDALVDRLYPKAEARVLQAIENANVDLANVDLKAMGFDESHPDTLNEAEYELLKQNEGIGKIIDAMEKAGIPKTRIWKILAVTLKKASAGGSNLKEALTDTAKSATKSGLTVVVQVILFILVLIIASILLQLLTNGIRRLLWKIDVIKTLDRFLGFLMGALVMLALIFVALYIFRRLGVESVEEKIGETLFAQFLNINNPLLMFFE